MVGFNEIPSMQEYLHNQIIEQINEFNRKKEQLFIDALNVKTGLCFDMIGIEKEAKRMFPRLKIVGSADGLIQTYYWNDLTENGLRIITFCMENKMNEDNTGFTQKLSWS